MRTSPAVLIVGSGLSGGGAERRFFYLAKYLFGGTADAAIMTGELVSLPTNNRKITHLEWKGRWSYPRSVKLLRNALKQKEYDLVFSFGLFPMLLVTLAQVLIRPSGRRASHIINEITRPDLDIRHINGIRRYLYSVFRSISYRSATLITANSSDGLRAACRLAGKGEGCGRRLPNIVDAKVIRNIADAEQGCITGTGDYIVCVGRLVKIKRLDTVLHAMRLLGRRSPFRLVILGSGVEETRLRALAHRLGVAPLIDFRGFVSNPYPVILGATALVLASEYEGFSNSVIEAMALGVPVITSFCSSDAQEMCECGAALGFEVGDSQKLSEQLERVLGDEEVRERLVSAAQRYLTPHLLENAVPVYEGLLLEVASKRRG